MFLLSVTVPKLWEDGWEFYVYAQVFYPFVLSFASKEAPIASD